MSKENINNKELNNFEINNNDLNNNIISYNSFDDMNLKENLLRGIYSYGFENPSVIQSKAIIPITTNKDVIAQAQSGTGKTATFSIGLLQKIEEGNNNTQSIILSPTRELSFQTYNVFSSLAINLDISVGCFRGGTKLKEDIEKIKNGVNCIIGTPGRIIDLIKKNILYINDIKSLVLDEADEMLDIGFLDVMRELISIIPKECQIILVSATLPKEVMELTEKFMYNPIKILVKKEEITLEGIKQFYVMCDNFNVKFEVFCDLYETLQIMQAVVFVNTKKWADELGKKLIEKDYAISIIHGSTEQKERDKLMENFRQGNSRILISSDIIGRGIDVQGVNLVINYDIPQKKENYIHRVGRCGRFGRKGVSINLITERDIPKLLEIERYYDTQISELPSNINELI